jgi:chromosome segregation ATPase
MNTERMLTVLLAQLQFELLEAGSAVAETTAECVRLEWQVDDRGRRGEQIRIEIDGVLRQQKSNPVLIQAMYRLYHAQLQLLRDSQRQLTQARSREEGARARFNSLRRREQSLEKMRHEERRRRLARGQARELSVVEDLWLQRGRVS